MNKSDIANINILQNIVTKKLVSFINEDPSINNIFLQIKNTYPFIVDDNYSLPYIMWLCCDYRDENNLSFVDKLIAKDKTLSHDEISILKGKKESYVSVFRIKSIKKNTIVVYDCVLKRSYDLNEEFDFDVIKNGDYLLARVGDVLHEKQFLGEIDFVNKGTLNSILRMVLKDYNGKNATHSNTSLYEYLKNESLSIYFYYQTASIEYMDSMDHELLPFYGELENFESYLSKTKDEETIASYLRALLEIKDFYLDQNDLSLDVLKSLDLEDFFDRGIKFKLITNIEDFKIYYNAIKEYLIFKSRNTQNGFKQQLEKLLTLSEDSFKYIHQLNDNNSFLNLGFNLSRDINDLVNIEASNYLDDFLTMIYHLIDFDRLELTPAKQYVKLADMENIRSFFQGEYKLFFTRVNQMKVPIFNLFYTLGINMNLFFIDNNNLKLTDEINDYLSVKESNRLWAHLKTLLSDNSISSLLGYDLKKCEDFRVLLFKVLSDCPVLLVDEFYKYEKYGFPIDDVMLYIRYLTFMGITSHSFYKGPVNTTNLGELLLPYIFKQEDQNYSKVLDFNRNR